MSKPYPVFQQVYYLDLHKLSRNISCLLEYLHVFLSAECYKLFQPGLVSFVQFLELVFLFLNHYFQVWLVRILLEELFVFALLGFLPFGHLFINIDPVLFGILIFLLAFELFIKFLPLVLSIILSLFFKVIFNFLVLCVKFGCNSISVHAATLSFFKLGFENNDYLGHTT